MLVALVVVCLAKDVGTPACAFGQSPVAVYRTEPQLVTSRAVGDGFLSNSSDCHSQAISAAKKLHLANDQIAIGQCLDSATPGVENVQILR